MSYPGAPTSVRSLEQRIRNLEGDDGPALRRRVGMALVVVGQMLPEGAIRGGSAMALRYGRGTRFTQDLDAARVQPLARFRSDFEDSLAAGWAGFTGRLVEKTAPRPPAVPTGYVMQPFEVKLDYRGRPWCTVKFELGHNEIGDADDPDYQIASDLACSPRLASKCRSPCRSCARTTRSHRSSTPCRARIASGLATSLTFSYSTRVNSSTFGRSARHALGSSTIDASRPGRRRGSRATNGTPSTQRQPRGSTCCRPSRRRSDGSTTSYDTSTPPGREPARGSCRASS